MTEEQIRQVVAQAIAQSQPPADPWKGWKIAGVVIGVCGTVLGGILTSITVVAGAAFWLSTLQSNVAEIDSNQRRFEATMTASLEELKVVGKTTSDAVTGLKQDRWTRTDQAQWEATKFDPVVSRVGAMERRLDVVEVSKR